MITQEKTKKDLQYPIHTLLEKRWSPRSFSEKVLSRETIHSLFEAARWAPSCYNDQPWYFVYATREEPEAFEKIADCLVEGNRKWAKDAPFIGLAIARKNFTHNGKNNRHATYDLGQSLAYFTFQAMNENVYVHQMAGFSRDKARETFDLEDGYEAVTAFVAGYLGKPEKLPDDLAEKERNPQKRRAQEDFAYRGQWPPQD